MKSKFSRRAYLFLLLFSVVACLTLCAGCQTTDKSQAFMQDSYGISGASCYYNSSTNQTEVVWQTKLTNDTVYNFSGFNVTFRLYNGSTLVKTETYLYNVGVKHGDEYSGSFSFDTSGKITKIELVSWSADYDSVWDTYKGWFVTMFVIIGVAIITYIVFMVIKDLNLSDAREFIAAHLWVLALLIVPFLISGWSFIDSNWIPALIIIGGVVALIAIYFLIHLVKFAVILIADNVSNKKIIQPLNRATDEDEDY